MSMLAAAGIYLVLDVNSPAPHHHLNRYEPWNSYNVDYLENIFKVIEQFSYYNNTLGFFAGNEIVNDITSANNSPVFVKAVIRDTKNYIEYNSPRPIPIGYSAADDLKYRMSFSEYLECMTESPAESVDFYGVNSYQWCGDQTFYTSGYNTLVNDYSTYSQPLFFSEYGCNEVMPRQFGEVHTLYSNDMVDVFSGGLVYQYSQEVNNYGLVEILPNGDVKLLPDFLALKKQFDSLPEIDYYHVAQSMRQNAKEIQNRKKIQKFGVPVCDLSYDNIDISKGLPKSLADDLIDYGVEVQRGKFIPLTEEEMTVKFEIKDFQNRPYKTLNKVEPIIDYMSGIGSDRLRRIKGYRSGMYTNDPSNDYDSDYSDTDELDEDNDTIFHKASVYLTNMFNSIANYFSQQ